MARLPNKKFQHIYVKDEQLATYADLLQLVVDNPLQGMTVRELRVAMSVVDACQAAKEEIEIPDDAVDFVKNAVENFRWRLPTPEAKREVIAFCEEVSRL